MVVLSTILKPKPKFPVGFKERARGGDWHEHERFMLLKGKHINPSATTLLVTIAYKASSFLTDSGDAIFLSREGCRRKLSTSDKIISALAMDHRRTAVDHHIMRHHCPSTTEIVIHTTTSPLTPSRVGFISPISRGILVNRRRAKLHVLGFSPSTFKAGGLSSSASLLVGHCSPRARYRTQQHQQQQQQQQRQHNRHQHGRRCHGVPKACRRTSTFMRMHGAGRGEGVVKQAFGGDDEGDANTMKRHAVRGGRRRSRMYITSSGSSSTSSSTTAEGGLETGDPARSHDGVAEEPETTPLVQRERRINVVLTHTTADFDSLAAAVGLAKLWQHELPDDECCVCMPRGMHPVVKRFMALHKNLFPIKALKDIDKDKVFRVGLVDAQRLDRIGAADSLLANATEVHVVDHHVGQDSDINATTILIEKVGSVSTIITEQLQHQELNVEAAEATLLALGVHADTGSLTFDSATSRDAASLAWLMEQGASQQAVAEYGHAALSPEQQSTLTECINNLNRTSLNGTTVSTALLRLDSYVSGMAAVAQNVLDVTDTDVFVLGAFFPQRRGRDPTHMVVIGRARSRMNPVNLDALMSAFGGGGHPKAAAASFRLDAHTIEGNRASPEEVMQELVDRIFMEQVKEAEVAEDIMTAPVQTCEPRQTMREVARILARHDIRGMPVVNEMGEVLGLISRREVEKVTKQGREDELVKGWMAHQFAMADVRDPLHEVEDLFIKEDVGRLPVVRDGKLVGLITRADMLRQHQFYDDLHYHNRAFATPVDSPMRKLLANLRKRLKKYDDD